MSSIDFLTSIFVFWDEETPRFNIRIRYKMMNHYQCMLECLLLVFLSMWRYISLKTSTSLAHSSTSLICCCCVVLICFVNIALLASLLMCYTQMFSVPFCVLPALCIIDKIIHVYGLIHLFATVVWGFSIVPIPTAANAAPCPCSSNVLY